MFRLIEDFQDHFFLPASLYFQNEYFWIFLRGKLLLFFSYHQCFFRILRVDLSFVLAFESLHKLPFYVRFFISLFISIWNRVWFTFFFFVAELCLALSILFIFLSTFGFIVKHWIPFILFFVLGVLVLLSLDLLFAFLLFLALFALFVFSDLLRSLLRCFWNRLLLGVLKRIDTLSVRLFFFLLVQNLGSCRVLHNNYKLVYN